MTLNSIIIWYICVNIMYPRIISELFPNKFTDPFPNWHLDSCSLSLMSLIWVDLLLTGQLNHRLIVLVENLDMILRYLKMHLNLTYHLFLVNLSQLYGFFIYRILSVLFCILSLLRSGQKHSILPELIGIPLWFSLNSCWYSILDLV